MHTRFIRLTLQGKIMFLLFIVTFISSACIYVYWYSQHSTTRMQQAELSLIDATRQAEQSINSFIEAKLVEFQSNSQTLSLLASNTERLEGAITHFLAADPDILSLVVVSQSGRELVKLDRNRSYSSAELTSISASEAYQTIMRDQQTTYIGPVVLTETRVPYITIATVMKGAPQTMPDQDDDILNTNFNILIGRVSMISIIRDMAGHTTGKSGKIIMVDNQGTIVAHPQPELMGTAGTLYSPSDMAVILNGPPPSAPSTAIRTSTSGQPILSAFTRINKTGWAVITEQPISEISRDISTTAQHAIVLFLIPLLLVGGAGFYMWHTLTVPLHHLATASNEFALGNYGHTVSIKSGDELQELADNYMAMVSTMLHEKRTTIDEKNILSAIVENTAHGVLALDVHTTIIMANKAACRLLRYLPQEVKGAAFDQIVELLSFDKRLLFTDLVSVAPEKRSSIKLMTRAGDQKDVAVTVVVLPPTDFMAVRYIITIADAASQEAGEAVKLDFVSMAAHELRTPLTAIRGYAQLIESNLLKTSDDETKEYVKRLSISCENLANLVDNLLNVTRIERNTLKLERMPLDVVAIIKSVVRDLKQQAETKQQTLEFIQPETPLPQVLADKYRIMQVVTNLVANAINYTPQSGKITVTVGQKDSMIETAIIDTGIGIPPESLPKLFTKFYRVSGALEEGSKGTGLGLFITKSIITMHKGEITVESERGKGSTFRFTLPVATPKDIEDHDNFIKNAVTGLQRKGLVVNTDRQPGHNS